MSAINPNRPQYDNSSESSHEKKVYNDEYPQEIRGEENLEEVDDHHHLHRGLKARQITMIAIGGAIGTGLIIGT